MAKTLLEIALIYHRQGWNVLPLKYRDKNKKPITSWKYFSEVRPVTLEELHIFFAERFTGDLTYDQIKIYFDAWKVAPTPEEYRRVFSRERNIGLITGKFSNLASIDCDTDEAVKLYESLGGNINGPYFSTQRGYQFLTLWKEGVGNFQGRSSLKDIDLRAQGGYCTVPPSTHWSGAHYKWHNIDPDKGIILPPFPDELLAAAYPKKRSQTGYTGKTDTSEDRQTYQEMYENPHGRNMTLTKLAGTWAKQTLDINFMQEQARVWNSNNTEPLDQKEIDTILNSIFNKEKTRRENKLPLDHRIATFYGCTDAGNAERFAFRYGKDVRCIDGAKWYYWCGTHWMESKEGEITQFAIDTVRNISQEAAGLAPNSKDYADIMNFATRSEAFRSIQAIQKIASALPPIPTQHSKFNVDPDLITILNGTMELKTQTLREHRREDLINQIARVNYDPEATCPKWMEFLDRIFDSNQTLIYYLQEVIGYCLTGHTTEQKMWILYGDGANGKTTLCNVISRILGDYAQPANRNLFMAKPVEGHPVDFATLVGKRFVVAEESEETGKLSESLVKQLTGCSMVTTRNLYQNFFSFLPTYKIFFQTNHKPEVREGGHGIWRRLKPIPFNVIIPESEQQRDLEHQLYAEASGILNWALRGVARWYERVAFIEAETVKESAKEYQEEMDYLFDFIDECCEVGDDQSCGSTELFKRYVQWAQENNQRPYSHKKFVIKLINKVRERFHQKVERTHNADKTKRLLFGIDLKIGI